MKIRSLMGALLLMVCANALANVIISGTRVIYPADARDVSVQLSNRGETPSLIQAWIDQGSTSEKPEAITVPFVLTPPMVRINPGKSQVLRLVYTGDALPKDKETVYWLNVLEIPPKPSGSSENSLQFAVRSRIKLFFRPTALKSGSDAAPAKVQWRAQREGKAIKLVASNPTAFYVSLAEVHLVAGNTDLAKPMTGMVAPGAELEFVFDGAYQAGQMPTAVNFKSVNDYGGFVDGSANLTLNPN